MKENGNNQKRREEMMSYFSGQGRREDRDILEDMLLDDKEAFSIYMEVLDEAQENLPSLADPIAFAEGVMEGLTVNAVPPPVLEETGLALDGIAPTLEGPRRSRWFEKPIFHYVIAASLTLLFLSSGVFDRLMTGEMNVVVKAKDNSASYSEQVMLAASGWLEQIMNDGDK